MAIRSCNVLAVEERCAETAGFTDHFFHVMPLLGFRFSSRIRDLGDFIET
ncbi:Tn3 family transposase [Polaromonas sp. CG_23.6]|nr:Tn3 family transposase [Polaromonas sp. CG_23.6]MDH6186720.1 TnpA family transposase [Polaromonas sp. CG_23.6]